MSDKTSTALGVRLRAFARAARNARRWTQDDLADQLTAAGYPVSHLNMRNREVRGSAVGVDEAVALAKVFGLSGVDALIGAAGSDCEQCGGVPPEGFTCNHCGAA